MSRLQQYRERMGAARVSVPGAVAVAGPPQGADGASRALATAIDGALARGMDLAAREHVRDQQTRMEERLLAARKEFGEWREQYQQTHQGSDALDAGEAFQAKFAEIAGRHLEAFGGAGNEVFRRQLGGRLAAAGVLAREQGAAYASGQRQAWEKSVREGQIAQLEQDAFTAPDNTPWLDMQVEGVVRDEAARGRDTTALRRSLASHTQLTRIRGLVDRGDLDGAARLLDGGDGGGGSRSERNLSAHNYGNVKNTSGGFHAYATRADGLMGVGERVLRYANAPDRGWHARTLRQMVDIYAPASDGNDPARYAAFLGERLGVRPDAEVDFRNPDVLAGLIRHMPVMEHGRGAAMTDAEAREAANRLLAGERPRIVGSAPGDAPGNAPDMTPEDAATARGLIERQRAKLEAADRKRKALARTAAAGFADAAAWGATGGDFSAAAAIVTEVEGLDADAGHTLRARLNARRTAWDVMRLHADRPLLEQREAALTALDRHVTPGDARDALALKADAERLVNQRMKGFRDDPAAFAAAARPELLRDGISAAERTRRLLDAQAVLGRGLSVAPRVLTKAQAAEMERAFTGGDPHTRLRLLTDWRADYGPYFTAAATEASLPAPVVALGPTLDRLPPSKAVALLSAVTAKPGDIPGADADARASARDAVAGLDFMRQLTAASRRFPANEAARALAKSWETALTNAALMGVEPEEATRRLDIAVDADPASGGGHILLIPDGTLPDGWDVDDLAGAAEAAREVVLRRLTDALPQGETPLQRRLLERGARHAAESGVWISAADGGSVHLVDEVSGLPVTYPDGAPIAFTLDDLIPIARERRRGAAASLFEGKKLFGGR